MISIYLEVAVPVPLRRTFHYKPPPGSALADCRPGQRLEVSFGRQKLVGLILSQIGTSDLPDSKIKAASRLVDLAPIFPESIFKLCLWAADYYHFPVGEVLHAALPAMLRQGEPATGAIQKLMPLGQSPDAFSRAPRQRALLAALIEQNGLTRSELKTAEFGLSVIKALIDKQAAAWQTFEQPQQTPLPRSFGEPLTLAPEQAAALEGIQDIGTHLLFGVTGSGKTEVYLQAIARTLRAGKQALVLVPEIGLTPQTIARFEQRFKTGVIAMHSGLTDRERLDAFRQAANGNASVVIGTRSAIFTPLQSPGLIVVDEEHDASFKQQEGFRYSARDLAVMRGRQEKVPVILGSATPSLETYANAQSGKYQMLKLTGRANASKLANYRVIGIEHQQLEEGFSPELVRLMKSHLDSDHQVLVFLNRRGFAPVLHCRQCLWLSACTRCDAKMTYHLASRSLVCHHCGTQQKGPDQCPACKSRDLVPLGLGTQRLEAGLQQLFPDESVLRIDRDSTRLKGALEEKITAASTGKRGILLGTQLLAKGHHFPNVTLVAIVDLDSGFYSSDFHAIERTGQLLLQVGGRSGREQAQGTVAIQTLFPEHPMLRCLIEEGYEVFCQELLHEREANELPPFAYQAIIRAEAVGSGTAMSFLSDIADGIAEVTTDGIAEVTTDGIDGQTPAELLGPISSAMEKRAGKFRAQLLATSKNRRDLHQLLTSAIRLAESLPSARNVRWSVDVDPFDLF